MNFCVEFRKIIKLVFVWIPIETIKRGNNKIKEYKNGMEQHLDDVSVDGKGFGDFRKYLVNRRVVPNDQGLTRNKMFLLMLTLLLMTTMTNLYLFFHNDTLTILLLGEYFQLIYDMRITVGSLVIFNGIAVIFSP